MRMIPVAVATAALLLSATIARAATFEERFKPATQTENIVEGTPFKDFGDALKTISIVLRIVDELDKIANQRSADLRAFVHAGGSWETISLWNVPVRSWPVITALADEREAADNKK